MVMTCYRAFLGLYSVDFGITNYEYFAILQLVLWYRQLCFD